VRFRPAIHIFSGCFCPDFGASTATSFWKRGSFRSGSNMGSSRSRAGVNGTLEAVGPEYGMQSSFCNAAAAWSGSPSCAAGRGSRAKRANHRVFLDRHRRHRLPYQFQMRRFCHPNTHSSAAAVGRARPPQCAGTCLRLGRGCIRRSDRLIIDRKER
jgi:hypothetical protein